VPAYRLITFDAYSALFDRDRSLVPVLEKALGSAADAAAAMQTWRAKQMEYAAIGNSLEKGRPSFCEATRLGLDYTLKRLGRDLAEAEREALVEAWDQLEPWPEAREVLAEVKARGYPIAVLSNGDEASLRMLARRFATPFDHVFSAEAAGFYKPHPAVYRLPLAALGLAGREVLHVAGGAVDALGAKAAGLACAWSNRNGDCVLNPAYAPNFEFADLTGLLKVI
jgi:2-haloacid dehalogenase